MKRYLIFLGFIAFGYVLGWTSSVLRFGLSPFPSRHAFSHARGPDQMFEGLDLDPDQKERIRKIREETEPEKEQRRLELDMARQDFDKALDSTQDREILQNAFARMLASKNTMAQAHFNSMMKIHEVLNLEQIKKLGENRPKRGHGGRWHRRDHMPPPPYPDRAGSGEPPPPPQD